MFTFFSIIVILSPIAAVIAAILWAISAVRKKETKAKRILAVSAALFVISFIGCAITAPPVDKTASNSQPSATQDMTQEQSQEPTQSLAPEPEDTSPSDSTTPSPEPTETLEEVTNPLSALGIQEHPVMNGTKTERIGTWASITTTKEFLSSVTDEQLFQYLNEVAENEYNWINVFFEDGTGLYCLGSMGGYLLEYGNVDQDEGGAVEYIGDISDCIYTFTDGTYSTETQVLSSAPANESDASATDEPLSLDGTIFAIELSLAAGFGENYTLVTDGNTISATVWTDGIAMNALLASSGNAENLEAWNDLVDSTRSAADRLQSLLNDNGHGDMILIMQVANDLNTNHDTVLLSVSLNTVLYDYVNGVNIFGD